MDFSIDVELLADAFGAFAECTSLKNNEVFFSERNHSLHSYKTPS